MNESRFTGNMLGFIGMRIGAFFIVLFTLGLGVPWAVSFKQRWFTQHQVIDGKKLVFTGSGSTLFGNYIKWFLLSIITFGIYALWIPLKIQAWVTKHTHLEGTMVKKTESLIDHQGQHNLSDDNSVPKISDDLSRSRQFLLGAILVVFLELLILGLNIIFGFIPDFIIERDMVSGILMGLLLLYIMIPLPQMFGKNKPTLMVVLMVIIVIYTFQSLIGTIYALFAGDVFTSMSYVIVLFHLAYTILITLSALASVKHSKQTDKTVEEA